MTTKIHHNKGISELPQIPRISPQRNKQALKNYTPLKSIHNKDPFSKILSQDSTASQDSQEVTKSTKITINNQTQKTQFLKNSYNPKPQTINIGMGRPNMLQKYLQKKKKYFRVDAHMKAQDNIIRNDIECLIEDFAKEKEKHDFMVLNLRENIQTNNRSLTFNKRSQTMLRTQARHSAKLVAQQQGRTCPIDLVNKFNLSKDKIEKKTKVQVSLSSIGTNCLMNTEIKNFRQILRQYIHNYQFSMSQESLVKNGSLMLRTSHKMTVGNRSSSTGTNFKGQKEDEGHNKKPGNSYFKEFIQLTEKSQDYLEYYLKSSFLTQCSGASFQHQYINERSEMILSKRRQEIDQMLKKMDKNVILSVLRVACKTLQPTYNSKQIVNRILMSLGIKPLNEFHFIKQETFTKLKKLICGQASRKQSRQFLLRYFCFDSCEVKTQYFDNLLYCVLNKLLPILNESTVEILYEKAKKICQQMVMVTRDLVKREASNDRNKKNVIKVADNKGKKNKTGDRLSLETQKNGKLNNDKQKDEKNGSSPNQSYYTRQEIKSMLFQDPFGMWDQILQLIFIV